MLNKKKPLIYLMACLILLILSGCQDAGDGYDTTGANNNDFDSVYSDYYTTYDDVIAMKSDKITVSYNYKNSIYNKKIINDLDWENDNDKIAYNKYVYYAIKPLKEKNFTEFSIYVRGEDDGDSEIESTDLTIAAYKVSDLKTAEEVPFYSDNYDANKTYVFNDISNAISSKTLKVTEGLWSGMTISLKQGDDRCTTFTTSDYLLIVFYNNTLFGKEKDLKEVSFQATNILICAKKIND